MKINKYLIIIIGLCAFGIMAQTGNRNEVSRAEFNALSKKVSQLQQRLNSKYATDGSVFNEGSTQDAGFSGHGIQGICKLVNGVDTITLNTNTTSGLANIEYKSDSTYSGVAFPLVSGTGNTYQIIPIAGNKFIIESSDNTDTATVRFSVEGE